MDLLWESEMKKSVVKSLIAFNISTNTESTEKEEKLFFVFDGI